MAAFREQLEALGYAPSDWQLPVTEEDVAEFERDYGLRLPAEYRAFLVECGGWTGSATCEFLERPTLRACALRRRLSKLKLAERGGQK